MSSGSCRGSKPAQTCWGVSIVSALRTRSEISRASTTSPPQTLLVANPVESMISPVNCAAFATPPAAVGERPSTRPYRGRALPASQYKGIRSERNSFRCLVFFRQTEYTPFYLGLPRPDFAGFQEETSGEAGFFSWKGSDMARPITLCTGQWADLPLETLAAKAKDFGFDGLELACAGDHFEVAQAISDPGYCDRKRKTLEKHGLQVFAISNHLAGQAVLDLVNLAIRPSCRPTSGAMAIRPG